jgi:hypothetical protein
VLDDVQPDQDRDEDGDHHNGEHDGPRLEGRLTPALTSARMDRKAAVGSEPRPRRLMRWNSKIIKRVRFQK